MPLGKARIVILLLPCSYGLKRSNCSEKSLRCLLKIKMKTCRSAIFLSRACALWAEKHICTLVDHSFFLFFIWITACHKKEWIINKKKIKKTCNWTILKRNVSMIWSLKKCNLYHSNFISTWWKRRSNKLRNNTHLLHKFSIRKSSQSV